MSHSANTNKHHHHILLWMLIAIIAFTGSMFVIQKVNAGIKAFISSEGAWSLAHTQANHALNLYMRTTESEHFDEFIDAIRTCIEIKESREDFDLGQFDAGRVHLQNSNIHPDNIPDLVFVMKYMTWLPDVVELMDLWSEANQHIVHYHATANLIKSAIDNQAAPHVIHSLTVQANTHYAALKPLENHFENTVFYLFDDIRTISMLVLIGIYALMGWAIFRTYKRNINAIRERDAMYHATFHHNNLGIIQVAINGAIQRMNLAFCDIFGVKEKDMMGRGVKDILKSHNNPLPNVANLFSGLNPENPTFTYNFHINSRKGFMMWFKATITTIYDNNEPLYYIAVIEDISETHKKNEELKQLANHDYLTGLFNKFSFENHLDEAINGQTQGVLFYLDLDHFKNINDTAGHAAGDQALKEVAQILRLSFRKNDIIARVGGDEFAAIVYDINLEEANNIKNGIIKSIEQHLVSYENHNFQLGVSIGLAIMDKNSVSSKQVMLQADTAAYEAKIQRRENT